MTQPRPSHSPSGTPSAEATHRDIATVFDAVRIIVRAIRLANVEIERQIGISLAQLYVLEQLAEKPASSVNELAERTLTHQSSVSVVVRRLVEQGYVTKTPARTDARRMELALSREGRALLERAPSTAQAQLIAGLERMPGSRVAELAVLMREWLQAAALFEAEPPMFGEEVGAREE